MIPIYILALVFGLLFGSFYNVCIARIPKGRSIVTPPSHCPRCLTPIAWYYNIPVLSFLWLKGRCAACQEKISWIYPGMEMLSGLLSLFLAFVLCKTQSIFDPVLFGIYFFFTGGLLVLSVIDLRYLIIPDRFTKGGVIAGILASTMYPLLQGFHTPWEGFVHSVLSAFICYGILNSFRWLGYWMYKREAMGYGDVKLVAAFGAFLGWRLGLLSIFFAAIAGSLVGLGSILFRHHGLRSEIPFGPYLALGAFVSLLFGEQLLMWYLQGLP